jgi:hypothetical protein
LSFFSLKVINSESKTAADAVVFFAADEFYLRICLAISIPYL